MARFMLLVALLISFTTPSLAEPPEEKATPSAQDTLKQFIEELQRDPTDTTLREMIIILALSMDPAPTVPVDAERHMAQGDVFIKEAAGANGYNKAIAEFQAAANSAPWLAIAYFNLGVIQEKVGFYTDAVQNLKFYLMAAPDAVNAREVKNKVAALQAEVVNLLAGKDTVAPPPPASEPAPVIAPPRADNTPLRAEPEKKQIIVKTPPVAKTPVVPVVKKQRAPSFVGNWFFKDMVQGEERAIQAFGIITDASGKIVAVAPQRGADYVPTIRAFEIADGTMKIEIHWRLTSVVGYWKIEIYSLTLSEDGTKLTGSYTAKSVGGRNIVLDKTLFRE